MLYHNQALYPIKIEHFNVSPIILIFVLCQIQTTQTNL
ncbi:hypothetical protein FM107_15615 [Sphingobacterium sp. JB170]|nr:hypothetical protein FM107_15615 [Sphingobacterium sp. JB170]